MKPSHIEHIGLAVRNLEESIRYWEQVFGLKCYRIEEVADQQVRTAFFKIGDTKIELLESMDADGPIARFIEKKGEGVHHIAFAVGNVEEALQSVQDKNIVPIDTKPRPGAEGMQIAFLHPKSTHGVLTELCSGSTNEK
ncbi:methylmalonyl-CoA epimerase [Niabella hirudinis]|uniref:methylmalonyl-CoA epimerase n=1 Tax=Niabella hirudinis TaxID=1285929 RepID=UPI003EB706C0